MSRFGVCSRWNCSSSCRGRTVRTSRFHCINGRLIVWGALAATTTLFLGVRAHAQGGDAGPPVFGVHDIELEENADRTEFETFVEEKFAPAWNVPVAGMQLILVRGDRGERKNSYQLIYVFDSIETRDQLFPREGGGGSQVFMEAFQAFTDVMEEFGTYVGERSSYTDYVPLGRYVSAKANGGPPAYGVHNIVLREDVDASGFEEFIAEKFAPAWKNPREGLRFYWASCRPAPGSRRPTLPRKT